MTIFSDLFIEGIRYDKQNVKNDNVYPFNIPAIKKLDELKFSKNVTFLIGENGVGKSTIIEAIAVLLKLNPEKDTEIYKTYKLFLDDPDYMQNKLFND